jgi:hypothetical protein
MQAGVRVHEQLSAPGSRPGGKRGVVYYVKPIDAWLNVTSRYYSKRGTIMAVVPPERDAILRAIENWPIDEQIALARSILQRAETGPARTTHEEPAHSTWDALYGIASNENEPPSDEQVAQWLEDR